MPEDIEIRPIRAVRIRRRGAATAAPIASSGSPDSPGWDEYLACIADVAGRADRATVLVALDAGAIAGSATLELDARISPGPTEPLAPDEAHLRMVGVSPEHRGKGIGRLLVVASHRPCTCARPSA